MWGGLSFHSALIIPHSSFRIHSRPPSRSGFRPERSRSDASMNDSALSPSADARDAPRGVVGGEDVEHAVFSEARAALALLRRAQGAFGVADAHVRHFRQERGRQKFFGTETQNSEPSSFFDECQSLPFVRHEVGAAVARDDDGPA